MTQNPIKQYVVIYLPLKYLKNVRRLNVSERLWSPSLFREILCKCKHTDFHPQTLLSVSSREDHPSEQINLRLIPSLVVVNGFKG